MAKPVSIEQLSSESVTKPFFWSIIKPNENRLYHLESYKIVYLKEKRNNI